jgi:transcriptional regulator with XRE-family HTH domain
MNDEKTSEQDEQKPRFEDRISKLIDMLGGPTRAATVLKRSRTTIDNWRSGSARISLEDAYSLTREAGVTLDWILAADDDREANLLWKGNAGEDFVRIAVFSASSDETLNELNFQPPAAFLRSWLNEARIAPETCAVVMVQDDAMAPEISPGDMLLVDRSKQEINKSGVYALLRRNAVLVRRVQVMVDGGLQLIPTNTLYDREKLAADRTASLAVAGRVRAVFKFVD